MMVAIRLRMRIGFGRRVAAVAGRAADHLAHPQAAAVDEERAEVAPVVAAAARVDARRASHLAAGHQQDLVAQAARFEVFDQGGDGVVERPADVAHGLGRPGRC